MASIASIEAGNFVRENMSLVKTIHLAQLNCFRAAKPPVTVERLWCCFGHWLLPVPGGQILGEVCQQRHLIAQPRGHARSIYHVCMALMVLMVIHFKHMFVSVTRVSTAIP